MSASSALTTALLIVRLDPALRDALCELVRAVIAGNTVRARVALDDAHAARRALLTGKGAQCPRGSRPLRGVARATDGAKPLALGASAARGPASRGFSPR